MSKYRVLALDGGGLRGLLTTILLERLCNQPGLEHAFDRVDLVAGNSSGALIALALAHGLGQPTAALTLARTRAAFEQGRATFGPRLLPELLGGWWLLSKYGTKSRERSVKALLGERTTLGDLQRHVLVPAFDLDNHGPGRDRMQGVRNWKPKLFHNFIGENSDRDMPAWKVALYSSAAPAYFPTADGYIDGGAYANNPSMCALAQVYDKRYAPDPKPLLGDVLLLSIGAGQNLRFVDGPVHRWGVFRWAPEYVAMATDGTVGVADYECRQMLGPTNYARLAPAFPADTRIQLDDFDRIEYLIEFARSKDVTAEIDECADWLRKHWMPGLAPVALERRNAMLPEKTSKHVGTATELTCLMPIKAGFIPVLDTRSYATRLRVVFKVLQGLRVISREVRALKPILDIVEAARTVHAFSWTIVAERQLLLSVSFDRPWEPYIRVVWKDLGPLLDLFLCNCEGFVPSTEGFEPFAAFVRQHQVEAGFYYPSSSLTVDDERYLVHLEKLQRDGAVDFEKKATTLVAEGPETLAKGAGASSPADAATQWLSVLGVLYGLRNLYPDDSEDHVFLHRAATALLKGSRPQGLPNSPELEWFDDKRFDSDRSIESREVRKVQPCAVQGGILRPYRQVSHGCVLLATVENPAEARKFIGALVSRITRASDGEAGDDVYTNIAFTYSGLRQLGVIDSVLARFPKEFREGMEARAGLLGDVRQNHPESWTLPEWNVRFKDDQKTGAPVVEFTGTLRSTATYEPAATPVSASPAPPVRMSSVDIVVTLHKVRGWKSPHTWTDEHPLYERVVTFSGEARKQGVRVLSVQPLRRYSRKRETEDTSRLSRDHFGFLDGISQPIAADVPDPRNLQEVETGELLVGFQNQRGDPAFPEKSDDLGALGRGSLIDNGSFLVVRKLRQNVEALNAVLDAAVTADLDREQLLAKMVGRRRDGSPLLNSEDPQATPEMPRNDFNFGADPHGTECPFHAHIRRGNPRLAAGAGAPIVPRIARRGLAYGPPYDEEPGADRGMMFMAYNASIAEQFEIIQRWMSGGNTPGTKGGVSVFSGQPDPLLGLPDSDGTRTYRFLHDGKPRRVDLGDTPFVSLQWGLYLFAPSIAALETIAKGPGVDLARVRDAVALGNRVIQSLQTQDDWATVLEDVSANQSGTTAAVYAAIRAIDGGVKRTPYGVVIASEALAMQVLRSDELFSVREYQHRFERSVGKGYLGMDRGREYTALSNGPNEALNPVTEEQACREAHTVTKKVLEHAIKETILKMAGLPGAGAAQMDPSVPIPLEPVVSEVLAQLAQKWFDIPDGFLIERGPLSSDQDRALHCPFHFVAPSRFVFSSPNPRDKVRELGESHGQQLLAKVREFVVERRRAERVNGNLGLNGEISNKLFSDIKGDDDLLARTLLGLVFGFVPTVYGNALQILGLWLGDETLWRVQKRLLASTDDTLYHKASSALRDAVERAMQTRPVPPLLHRTATAHSMLGGVSVEAGDRVVIGIAGVTQEILARGGSDVMPVFGGDRRNDVNHPTHACPGSHIAMGVLLGLLSAILELGTLKPASAQVTVRVTPRLAVQGVRI